MAYFSHKPEHHITGCVIGLSKTAQLCYIGLTLQDKNTEKRKNKEEKEGGGRMRGRRTRDPGGEKMVASSVVN